MDYTAKLNWFLPSAIIPALAAIATVAETLFGLLLLLGWKTRVTSLLSGLLLDALSFGEAERPSYMPRYSTPAEFVSYASRAGFSGVDAHKRSSLVIVTAEKP